MPDRNVVVRASESPALFAGDASAMAAFYESAMVPGLFEPWAADLADRLSLRPSDHVLDVACGTGALTAAIAARLGDGGRVLGTDLTPAMIALAQRKQISRAEFRVGDAVNQPVGTGEFSAVVCQQGLQFVPNRSAAMAEMRRALQSGGCLAVSCWTSIEEQPPFAAFSDALRAQSWHQEVAAMAVPFSLSTTEELAELAESHGFEDLDIQRVTKDVRLPPAREWAAGYAAVPPFATAFGSAAVTERAAFLDQVEQSLSLFKGPQGIKAPMTAHVLLARAFRK